MAIGKRRKKDTQSRSSGKPRNKSKRANELLSSVIKESVVGAAIDVMKANPRFAISDNKWVILLLPADNIGGLSMKQKNDENKGSIIELIRADEITSLATADMLNEDIFGIIPTEHTLERMDEFSILIDAEYLWGIVSTTDDGAGLNINIYLQDDQPATFEEAKNISDGKWTLADIGIETEYDDADAGGMVHRSTQDFAPEIVEDDDELVDEFIDDDDDVTAVDQMMVNDVVDEDEPVFEEIVDDEPIFEDSVENTAIDGVPVVVEETEDPFTDNFTEVVEEPDGEEVVYEEYVPEDDGIVVSREEVIDGLNRRYFADDLNIEVFLENFNTYFQPQDEPLQFVANPVSEDDWLGNQLNHLTARANDELANLRRMHIDEARKLYLDLMSKHVETVVSELNTSDVESYYGDLLNAAELDYKKNTENADKERHEQIEKLTAAYEANIEAKRQEAAAQAEVRYREKHGAVFDNELRNISNDIDAVNVERLRQNKALILDMRRADAATRMDIGTNEVLSLVQARWSEMYEDEAKVLSEWQHYMIEYLDEHRKEDVARIEILQQELASNNEIERMRRDFQLQTETMQAQADAAIAQSREELASYKETVEARMQQQESEWALREKKYKYEQERSNDLSKKLMKELKNTEKLEHKRYKRKLAEMKQANKQLSKESFRDLENQSRFTKLLVFIMFIFALAALVVGILVGFVWSSSSSSNSDAISVDHTISINDSKLVV